ncbi:MAG: hypothetical protein H6Q32_1368, partial [Bacteroidetes bacterium]|nr:hypothetical protein [Bacteroidota bacterium]
YDGHADNPRRGAARMTLRPAFAEQYPFLVCALSTRLGGVSSGSFGMNLSYAVGDDPEAVTLNRKRFFGSLGIGIEDLVLQHQVHGDNVRPVIAPGAWPAGDGWSVHCLAGAFPLRDCGGLCPGFSG